MVTYISRMDWLCSQNRQHLDHIHISTILYGTAQICITDKAQHGAFSSLQVYGPEFTAFLSSMLSRSLQLLPKATCRGISNILGSFARLNLNPDDLVPGSGDSLAQQFVYKMGTATDQSYSSVLLACVSS